MNADFPQNEREQLEAQLTALLFGELPADEAIAISKAMEQDAELKALYERLQATIGLVRESAKSTEAEPQANPLKLSSERREKLLAQFKTVAPKEFAKPKPRISPLIQLAAVLVLVGLLAALLLPSLAKSKNKAMSMLGSRSQSKENYHLGGDIGGQIPTPPELMRFRSEQYVTNSSAFGLPPSSPIIFSRNAQSLAPKTEIVLPSSGQSVPSRNPKWIGQLEQPAVSHATNDMFFSRNATIVPSSAPLLDQGSVTATSGRSQTSDLGIDSTNSTALTALSSSTLGGYVNTSAAWNLGVGNANEPAYTFGGAGPVRGFYDDNLNYDVGVAKNESSGKASLWADSGGKFDTGLTRDDVSGFRYSATNFVERLNLADSGNQAALDEPIRRAQIVLPSQQSVLTLNQFQANGGSMSTGGFGGKQVEIAAEAHPVESPQMLYFGDSNTGNNPANTTKSDTSSAYLVARQNLENEKRWRQILAMRTGQEEVDKNLPESRMISIPDPATAASPEHESFGQKIRETLSGKVERSARIEIEQEHSDIGGMGTTVASGYDPYFIQTEFETIKSAAVLQKVVEELKLDGGDKSKTKAAVEQLRKNVDVSSVKNTKFIEITAANAKPEDAANIANSVARAYKDYRFEEYADLKNRGIDSLKQQLAEQDQKVKVAQAKVDELRKGLGMPDYVANAAGATSFQSVERLKELDNLRAQKEADYNQQNTLLEKLKSMDHANLERALPIAVSDSQINTLIHELDLAEQDIIKLKIDYTPDHPKYKAAQELVDDLNRKIDEHADGIVAGLDTKVTAMKASLDTLDREIEAARRADIDNAAKTAPYFAAKDQLENEQRERAILMAKQADAALPKPVVPPRTPQPETLTRENAFSTFSLNVSDVSFKLAAASLEKGQMPEPASIRSEEFINAFNYRDPDAGPGVPIAFNSERARYPFAHNRELLRFSLKTAAAGRQAGRPLNIVLLLDNSGSMERADRVRIIQEALRVLAGQLQKGDTFSIVTFARTAQLRVDGIAGDQAAVAAAEIARLTPEGGTNLGEALDLAYETARHHYLANGDNRVVLLTDGAANLGDVKPEVLKQKVEAHRKQGIALDCFGIGWEDYNDDLLEVLTRNGDGRYGFLNKPEEASAEFVAQIAGALHVAAADVKVQVEFNPKRVTSYRQIGYAKHQLTKEQFRDNTVDAAEIAAQEAGNALYTIETNPQGEGSIATVRVRYKIPATGEYREQAWDVPYTGSAMVMDQASPAMRLATTASAFSEWLATSPFAAEVTTDQLLRYLNGVPKIYGADTRPAKMEWMIRQAKSISGK